MAKTFRTVNSFINWEFSLKSWLKRLAQNQKNIRDFAYPADLRSLWLIILATIALHFFGRKAPNDLAGSTVTPIISKSICYHLVVYSMAGLFIWLCVCLAMRYTLKLLLMYKGWMYESRTKGSKVSLATRLWATAINALLIGNKPSLFSFQKSLPRLPVPSVNETLTRYLNSIRPILNVEQYKRMQELAADFEETIASKLQRYLVLKSWKSSNYVSDWWEDFVYLRGRTPLMINSNYYCLDVIADLDSEIQSARAAVYVYLMLRFRQWIDRQELQPIMIQNIVPICSWQYKRTFNTTRVPGIETDQVVHYQDSNHIVVMHKGRYFKVIIYYEGRILNAKEIQVQLEQILNSKAVPLPGEERLASLTAWNRTKWAEVRNSHFNKGINADSLHTIESAAFVLSLDDEAYEVVNADERSALNHFGRSMFHGNGHNRWFDKSFTFCVGTNGRIGFNAEHSWADATVIAHLWENSFMDEAIEQFYDENGNCKGTVELKPPPPQRLSWDLNSGVCLSKINEAHNDAQKLINDLELRIYRNARYGKAFIKKCRLSPDAYLQMALQLAYYRDAGRFTLTYEASMTRLFLEGRTETVRSVTMESAAWVKAMENNQSTKEHRISLLREACERHQISCQDAMCGKGIDRHLFGLYIISKYLELDSPFLKEALGEPWRLSTSQTPHGFSKKLDLRKYPNRLSLSGGFGPTADDGYGTSYIFIGENEIAFHVTTKASCPTTDAERFSRQIQCALVDMKNLFD